MRVTLLASADFAVPTLDRLLAAGHEVCVGTQPSRRAGRGRLEVRPTPIGARCEDLGLAARELDDCNSPESIEWLSASQPDVIVVVAFGQKLGAAVRAAAPWGCLNIHPSLLPRWRGAAPVQAALLAGDDTTGVCIIDVVERMDAGALLAVKKTPTAGKTAGDLLDELSETGAQLMLEVIDMLARGDVMRSAQNEDDVTRAKKVHKDDGRIRWEHDAAAVDCRVRAMTPKPGAFTCLPDGSELRLLSGTTIDVPRGALPGEVLDMEGLVIACGTGAYRVERVQRQGRKPMDVADYLRGATLTDGVRMGP